MTLPTLTLGIIAKYDPLCFQALVNQGLKHCQQVVVIVDDGAADGIEGYRAGDGVQYHHHALNNNFSQQRTFLVSKAVSDWILHLDTDETLDPWLWPQLPMLLATIKEDLVLLPRVTRISDLPDWRGAWPDWQPKLHRVKPGLIWTRPVHEWPSGYEGEYHFPVDEKFAIRHVKASAALDVANQLYSRIFSQSNS